MRKYIFLFSILLFCNLTLKSSTFRRTIDQLQIELSSHIVVGQVGDFISKKQDSIPKYGKMEKGNWYKNKLKIEYIVYGEPIKDMELEVFRDKYEGMLHGGPIQFDSFNKKKRYLFCLRKTDDSTVRTTYRVRSSIELPSYNEKVFDSFENEIKYIFNNYLNDKTYSEQCQNILYFMIYLQFNLKPLEGSIKKLPDFPVKAADNLIKLSQFV